MLAAASPPLRPAAFFCWLVPPWILLRLLDDPEPDFLPPRLDALGVGDSPTDRVGVE